MESKQATEVQRTVAAIAREVRFVGDASPKLPELRRDLAAAKLAAYIKRVVDDAPPLSDAQKATLSRIINGGAS